MGAQKTAAEIYELEKEEQIHIQEQMEEDVEVSGEKMKENSGIWAPAILSEFGEESFWRAPRWESQECINGESHGGQQKVTTDMKRAD